MKKAKFIINPSSGKQNFDKHIESIIGYLIMKQIVNHIDVSYTQKQDDAKNSAMEIKKGEYDFVVAIGGDGTLNEVINGIILGKSETPIAIISAGTVNDFANYLNLPQSVIKFGDMIKQFKLKNIDVGEVNGKYFINVLAGGLLTDVGYKVPKELKAVLGKAAYYIEGAKDIPKYMFHTVKLKFESEEYEAEDDVLMFIIANSQSVGGFKNVAPMASVTDNLLDVLILKKVEVGQISNLLIKLMQGEHFKHPSVKYFQTKALNIQAVENEEIPVDYDGECLGNLPVSVKVIPNAIKIIVP